METNVNNLFREVVQDTGANCSVKRPSKSRSRVWEKVIWFTRKAKGGKDNKAAGASSPDLHKSNVNTNPEFAGENKALDVEKSTCKHKVRKTRSFKYLKRRKVRQFGDDLSSVVVEEDVNVQDCGTATGTFHDFQSERRISCQERTTCTSNNNLVSEIVRGMNPSQLKVKENVKSVLSLPLQDLSLNEEPIADSFSPSFPRMRRSVSFSGPAYNSWPRKKRTHLENSSPAHLQSPPLKQKRLSGIRKRASFSGFDSSRINLKNSYLSLCQEFKSTPHLAQGGHIRNQNGLSIGAIHFYKSPVIYQKETTLKLLQPKRQEKVTYDNPSVTSSSRSSTYGSDIKQDRAVSVLLPKQPDMITYGGIPETSEQCDTNATLNCSMLTKCNDESKLVVDEQTSSSQVAKNSNNCLSFSVRSSDAQNSTISAFLLEGECSSSCMTTSPVDSSDEDLNKEKLPLSSSSIEHVTPVDSTNQDIDVVDDDVNNTALESKSLHEDVSTRRHSNKSNEAMDIPEDYVKVPEFVTNKQKLDSLNIYQDCSLPVVLSDVTSTDNKTKNAVCTATHCDGQNPSALSSCRLPFVDEISKVEVRTAIPGHCGNAQTLWTGTEMIWQRKPTINGPEFKKCSKVTLFKFQCSVLNFCK